MPILLVARAARPMAATPRCLCRPFSTWGCDLQLAGERYRSKVAHLTGTPLLLLQAAMAAKAAAAGASPLHTEPQTPELTPGELRSPSFPVGSRCSL